MENLADTFAMLRQSRTVLGIDLIVVLCVLAANIGGAQPKPLSPAGPSSTHQMTLCCPSLLSCDGRSHVTALVRDPLRTRAPM